MWLTRATRRATHQAGKRTRRARSTSAGMHRAAVLRDRVLGLGLDECDATYRDHVKITRRTI